MTSRNPTTFATQMEKKYPHLFITVEEWKKAANLGYIEVRSKEDLTQSFQVDFFVSSEFRKLIFSARGDIEALNLKDGDIIHSFRKATTSFFSTKKSSKKDIKKHIQDMIANAPAAELQLIWIPRMMERQLEEEQDYNATVERNGYGLNKADAYPITRMYKRTQKGGLLTEEEVEDLHTRLLKYWKQYYDMMTTKEE